MSASPKGAGATGRKWASTAETRTALLAAAREVFTSLGFTNATVGDIVARAGSSNGSLYHHFGGKGELFVAMWEDYQHRQEEGAARAVAEARSRGVTDPVELFVTGSRQVLQGSWRERELTQLFMSGDAPVGFEPLRRQRNKEWVRQSSILLQAQDKPLDRALVLVFQAIISETGRELASCDDEAEARSLIEDVLRYILGIDYGRGRASDPPA